jgi:hypothetical protein
MAWRDGDLRRGGNHGIQAIRETERPGQRSAPVQARQVRVSPRGRLRKSRQDIPAGTLVCSMVGHDGHRGLLTAAPFEETTITAHDDAGLLEEIWSALSPRFRVAAAALDPDQGPAGAVPRSA